jgi:hypothetical protein
MRFSSVASRFPAKSRARAIALLGRHGQERLGFRLARPLLFRRDRDLADLALDPVDDLGRDLHETVRRGQVRPRRRRTCACPSIETSRG